MSPAEEAMPERPLAELPSIPGFTVHRVLGRGGMATVYLASQESLQRPVALKLLHAHRAADFSERFAQEGLLLARLHHRNVLTVFDRGFVDGSYYIAMELAEGGDLRWRIDSGWAPLALARTLLPVCEALSYLHNEGVVHRDVKPTNILFRDDDTPLLSDFGIAKTSDLTLTQPGEALGSPRYWSPEQALGEPADHRSDLYSLGIVLYEVLIGRPPYRGTSHYATVEQHLKASVPRLPKDRAVFQPLLDDLLAKTPGARPESAQLVGERLSKALARSGVRSGLMRPARRGQPKRRRRSPPVAASALVSAAPSGQLDTAPTQISGGPNAARSHREPAVPARPPRRFPWWRFLLALIGTMVLIRILIVVFAIEG